MEFKNESELIEWVYDMHLQNLNGREDFVEAFKKGIEATIEELKDLKLLGLADVVVQKRSDGTYCDRCNEEIETIGVCEICEMELRENL